MADQDVNIRFRSSADTRGAKEAARSISDVERELNDAKKAFRGAAAGSKEFTAAADRIKHLNNEIGKVSKSTGRLGRRGDAGRAALEFSRAFEDAQYGVRGVLNNIPILVASLGGGAGLAGVISIAAVAGSQLWERLRGGATDSKQSIEEYKEAFEKTMDAFKSRRERDEKDRKSALEDDAQVLKERLEGDTDQQGESAFQIRIRAAQEEADILLEIARERIKIENLAHLAANSAGADALKYAESREAAVQRIAELEKSMAESKRRERMALARTQVAEAFNSLGATRAAMLAGQDELAQVQGEFAPYDNKARTLRQERLAQRASNLDELATIQQRLKRAQSPGIAAALGARQEQLQSELPALGKPSKEEEEAKAKAAELQKSVDAATADFEQLAESARMAQRAFDQAAQSVERLQETQEQEQTMSWTIKGETGAALDAVERPLAAINATSATLTLASLESDRLEWIAATDDATGSGTVIPDAGQLVELYHDGTRRFRGTVTIPRMQTRQATITAEGPWWWLSRSALTSAQEDQEGGIKDRPSFVFPTQDVQTSISALIERAIEAGAPIQLGTVDPMFSFPRVTLSQMSFAQALAELLRIVPDAVAWFDYSVDGLPALNVSRRPSMPSTTYDLGTDQIEDFDVFPRLDLEVRSVQVDSVTRNESTGRTQWATQTDGDSIPGKTQVVVVSGPEVTEILPPDPDDSVELISAALPAGISISSLSTSSSHSATSIPDPIRSYVLNNDPNVSLLINEIGGSSFETGCHVSNGGRYLVSAIAGSGNGAYGIFLDKPRLNSNADLSGLYLVTNQTEIPDWLATENGFTVERATMSGTVRFTRIITTGDPSYWEEAKKRAYDNYKGYRYLTSSQQWQYNAFFAFSVPCVLINQEFATATTVHRKSSFEYVQPPSGLAANLRIAQGWIPYEGRIRTVSDQVDGRSLMGSTVNIGGGPSSYATMKALPKRISYEIQRGRTTVHLGAPARVDFGTLANRFRRSPQDNITYIE